jgi:hypothetical protein
MYSEKTGIIIACAVALLAIFAVGAGSVTGGVAGNVMRDPGAAMNLAIGLVLFAVFAIAAISVLKVLVPEGRFHQ